MDFWNYWLLLTRGKLNPMLRFADKGVRVKNPIFNADVIYDRSIFFPFGIMVSCFHLSIPFLTPLPFPFLSLIADWFPSYLPHYSTSLQLLSCRYVSLSPLFHLPSRSLPPLLHLKVLLGRYPIGLIYLCLIRLGLITPLLFFVYAVLKPPCGCFMWCELSLFPFFVSMQQLILFPISIALFNVFFPLLLCPL